MARPTKQGIDYFPIDVGFLSDIKIRKIMKSCGVSSIGIIISIFSNIYRDNGYFISVDEDLMFLIADELGIDESDVQTVVDKAVEVELFDSKIHEQHRVLTSSGIQKRYLTACGKRKSVEVNPSYWIGPLPNDSRVTVTQNIKRGELREEETKLLPTEVHKVKESKVKESKVKNNETDPTGQVIASVIKDLNERAGTSYRASSKVSQKFIQARINDGFTLDNFLTVNRKKVNEWKGSDMEKFIRPETLYGTKFEGYLNQSERTSNRGRSSNYQEPPPQYDYLQQHPEEDVLSQVFGKEDR